VPATRHRAGADAVGRGDLADPPHLLLGGGDQRPRHPSAWSPRLLAERLYRQPPAGDPGAAFLPARAPAPHLTVGKRGPGPPPGPRGTGRARRDRRTMRRGGEGVAADLNRVVGGWFGVRITPMFGRFGYFVGERLFACYPIRPRDHDLWVRLSRPDQARA